MKGRTKSVSSIAKVYVYIMFVYISFEAVILNAVNVLSQTMLVFVRYGIEIIGYAILVLLIASKRKNNFKILKFDVLLIAVLLIGTLSNLINWVPIQVLLIGLRYFFRYLYVYMIIRLSDWGEKETDKLFRILRKVMIIEILLVVWQIVNRTSSDYILHPQYGNIIEGFNTAINAVTAKWAVYGSFGRYNLFGYFITLAIWYWIAECTVKRKWKNVAMLVIWVLILIITFSRQTIVSIAISYVLYLKANKKLNLRQVAIVILLVALGAVLVISAASFQIGSNYLSTGIGGVNGTLYDRYVSMFSMRFLQIDYEGHGRTWFITEGIRLLLSEKPLLGFGIGMYGCPDTSNIYPYVYELLNIPRTYYMDVYIGCIIGQIGLIGFILYMLVYKKVLNKSKENFNLLESDLESKRTSIVTYGIVLSALIMMCFSSSLSNRIFAYYIWVFIGIEMNRKKDGKELR